MAIHHMWQAFRYIAANPVKSGSSAESVKRLAQVDLTILSAQTASLTRPKGLRCIVNNPI